MPNRYVEMILRAPVYDVAPHKALSFADSHAKACAACAVLIRELGFASTLDAQP